ncbi:MAG: anthranilate synthase component I [Pseudomonadota bacterium]
MKINPSFSEFKRAAEKGNLVPVYQEFLADTETPVSTYLKISDRSFSYLLESAEGGMRWGRYSFIGYKPLMIILSHDRRMEIRERGQTRVIKDVENPLLVLRDLFKKLKQTTMNGLPPFQGGLVGYCNYDLVRKWERLPGIKPEDPELPESIFTLSRRLIIFDHLTHQIKVISFALLQDVGCLKEAYEKACDDVRETVTELQGPLPPMPPERDPFCLSPLESNFREEAFKEAVLKAKEHIVSGDIIQVVLSQRFSGEASGDDFALYRNLRSVNPSPYMFYLDFGKIRLIGSSPEILVRLSGGRIELRPIAGTRPRGKTTEEDQTLEQELLADPKERAEHIMLVDLGRNDVGRVAMPGSVQVSQLMAVERYSHVMHIVSQVEGILKEEMDGFDLFMAAFPAGTVTGAPKVRAMEILGELEPSQRGPYAGAVGYFGLNGNMDFCITIRTIVIINNRLTVQVGAGIVYDSSPEKEYQETLRKAAAMFEAIDKGAIER